MKLGITGGTGFIGKRLTELALEHGCHVRCLVRKKNVSGEVLQHPNVEVTHGDLLDSQAIKKFLRDLDVCVHLAAHVKHGTKKEYMENNVEGTRTICKGLATSNPDCRLVYCSSIAALRLQPGFLWLGTDYAVSKYHAERVVKDYAKNFRLKTTIIYPGLILGPQDSNFVPNVLKYLKAGKVVLVSGGEEAAPLIYIDDICELFLLCATEKDAVGNKYLGIGNCEVGMHDFFRILAEKTDCRPPTRKIAKSLVFPIALFLEMTYRVLGINNPPIISRRVVDVLSINAKFDQNLFETNLGWEPKISVRNGIEKTLEWYRNADQA